MALEGLIMPGVPLKGYRKKVGKIESIIKTRNPPIRGQNSPMFVRPTSQQACGPLRRLQLAEQRVAAARCHPLILFKTKESSVRLLAYRCLPNH